VIDVDGTSADNIPFVVQPGVGKFSLPALTYALADTIPYFVTQEFQLVSSAERPFSWIVGAFGIDSRDSNDPFNIILNSATFAPIAAVNAYNTTIAYAGYAQGTYAFDNGLKLTAGGRYSDEHKHTAGGQSGGAVLLTDDKKKTWESVTYRFAADYRFNEKLLAYASASKGFKSGAFNVTSIDKNPAVNPETLYDYEVGVKADPFPWLRIDGSAYHYDYKNIQFYAYPQAAGLPILENAAAATLYGSELDVEMRPLKDLTLTGNIAWEHSRYDSFNSAQIYIAAPVAGEKQISGNATGQPVIRTPKLSGNLGASYDFRLPRDSGQLTLASNVYHNSGYSFDPIGVIKQPGYSVVGGSLTWALPGGKWSAAAWAKNLADERYYTQVVAGGRGVRVGYDLRTYGLNVRYQLK
ncbi:MAG: iron complex outerrane recepter protein, partial [Gammaproteobacteria bacterium]|nr:iron complex outerrane recepter protein [Gammaproteobacteria bacterium]